MRQIVLDTETTGLEVQAGNRIVEIACVEIIDRDITERTFCTTLNPEREVEEGAREVHGYTWDKLKDSPLFADIYDEFISFVRGSEVLMHNAPFDLGFLDAELKRLGRGNFKAEAECTIVDTLEIAKELHKGQSNNLDALSDRYRIDRSHRQLHGALIDAELLARVYLAMTSGQTSLSFAEEQDVDTSEIRISGEIEPLSDEGLAVIEATSDELSRHENFMQALAQK